jgi:hypothetical protein
MMDPIVTLGVIGVEALSDLGKDARDRLRRVLDKL